HAGAALDAASPRGTLWVIMGSLGRQSTARAHPAPRLDWNLHGPLMGRPLKEWLSSHPSGASVKLRSRPRRDATLSSGERPGVATAARAPMLTCGSVAHGPSPMRAVQRVCSAQNPFAAAHARFPMNGTHGCARELFRSKEGFLSLTEQTRAEATKCSRPL